MRWFPRMLITPPSLSPTAAYNAASSRGRAGSPACRYPCTSVLPGVPGADSSTYS